MLVAQSPLHLVLSPAAAFQCHASSSRVNGISPSDQSSSQATISTRSNRNASKRGHLLRYLEALAIVSRMQAPILQCPPAATKDCELTASIVAHAKDRPK